MNDFERSAQLIAGAEALIITAGAGMGVDSGLPDFRGDSGFWKAYPALYGYSFVEMANPDWFRKNPNRAWGFYGHRLNLYRSVVPHEGFSILRKWASLTKDNYFIFTSNVDGQFQKAGFSEARIVECHGSIHHLQDLNGREGIWSAEDLRVAVDEENLLATEPLPRDAVSGEILRPNILMFGDGHWNGSRTRRQEERYGRWLEKQNGRRIVIIELGAGTSVPTVRFHSQRVCRATNGYFIRINPRESMIEQHHISNRGISIPMGAASGLRRIQSEIEAY